MRKKDYEQLPDIVKDYFDGFVRLYGISFLHYVGRHDDCEYYSYAITDGSENGFPAVIAVKDGKLTEYRGFDALHAIDMVRK